MDQNIKAFLNVLDAKDNSTGGGSASAIAGAMAAGLAAMVARLSMDKPDLKSTEHYAALAARGEELATVLFEGAREDSEAFAVVSASFKMPKGTDEEKTARSRAIKDGMLLCAQVPLKNAANCLEVQKIYAALLPEYNTNAASDLECAGHLAQAGLKGCAANVRINLPYVKDDIQRKQLEDRLGDIIKEANAVCQGSK